MVLDLDSSAIRTNGKQEGAAYSGHFGCTCNQRLFVFNQFGDPQIGTDSHAASGSRENPAFWHISNGRNA